MRRGFEGLLRDLRLGVRQMALRPRSAFLAVATLALGLATGTSVFTYTNAYTRPLPGAEADGLYQIWSSSEEVPFGALSWPDYLDLEERVRGRFGVSGLGLPYVAASVRHEDRTEVAFGEGVTGGHFSVLGVEMALGRGVTDDDDRPGAPATVVLSHAWWLERWGGGEGAVGSTLLLNNEPYTVVGVAGPDFMGADSGRRPQFWIPLEHFARVYWARSDRREDREAAAVSPYLRLRAGARPEQAQEALSSLAEALDGEAPLPDRSRRFVLRPATWISPATRSAEAAVARIMALAAAGLLLLACANVANLTLSAGVRRSREMALRRAVGASRGRLIRQLTAESVLLALLAGGVALLVAGPVGNRLSSYFARPSVWGTNVPREIAVDPRVMLFALAAAVATGVLTGIVPAIRASGRAPAEALKAGGAGAVGGSVRPGRRLPGMRDLLISAQIGLSVVLLFVAALVLQTLGSASRVDAGFDTGATVASYVSTSSMGVPVEERHAFFGELVRRFEAEPWVEAATVAQSAPLSPHPAADFRVGRADAAATVRASVARVWPGFFEVLGMETVEGRTLARDDTVGTPAVVVVNVALATRIAAGESALGHALWLQGTAAEPDAPFEVVGVVRDARQTSLLEAPEPVAYLSLTQGYSNPGNAFLVKVRGDPSAAPDRIERELREVDTRIAIVNVLPYRDVVRGFLYVQRMNAELFSIIAALALLLSSAGVFGVVGLAVAQRRREIGIRLAVGGDPRAIAALVVGMVSIPTGLGVVVGLAGALVAGRFVEGLVWNVAPTHPAAMAAGAVVILAAVATAVWGPVRRALRVDPAASLRVE